MIIHNKLLLPILNNDQLKTIDKKIINVYNQFRNEQLLVNITDSNIKILLENYKNFIDNIANYNPTIYIYAIKKNLKMHFTLDDGGIRSRFLFKYNNSVNKNNDDLYYNKYLKYKTKYNQIKNKI